MADTEDTGVLVDHGDGKPPVSLPPGSFDGDKLAADLENVDHDDNDAVQQVITAAQTVVEAPPVTEEPVNEFDPHIGIVTLEETGSNGFYTVNAPWLKEPLKIRGKEKAEAEVARLTAEGPPKEPENQTEGEGTEGQAGGEA